jgi:hypothetical protein
MWTTLAKSVKIVEPATYSYLPKPDAAVLDQFEMSHGMKLPETYREFAKLFGAGELGEYYRIAVPLCVADDYGLQEYNQGWQKAMKIWEDSVPRESVPRMLFFAGTIGGESYAWDTGDCRDPVSCEHAIYLLPRDGPAVIVAESFLSFVQQCVAGTAPGIGKLRIRRVFSRFVQT